MKNTSFLLVCFLPQNNVWAVIGYPNQDTLAMEPSGYCREMTGGELAEYVAVRKATDD